MKRFTLIASVLILILPIGALPGTAQERPAVGIWNFEGNLVDHSGRGNDAFATDASFESGHTGRGLRCDHKPAVVPDSPELRPAPGLRIECWVKLESIGPSWKTLLIKPQAYQLRVDPPNEGGHFAFFLDIDGWEPRVRSPMPAKVGMWYHVAAGWDGKEIWLDVDGQRTSVRRSGAPLPSGEPLELGPFDGVLDELRIENPAAPPAGVAQWLFEGSLHDASGHGHDLSGKEVEFAPVPGGQALRSGSRAVQVASDPQLQLAPGFRLDCSVYFDKVPAEGRRLAIKEGEYQLRLNSAKEGGCFAFFVHLDGWEPRVSSTVKIEPGKWYRLTARWDGSTLTLDVNGERSHTLRSGLAKGTNNPLVIGGLGGLIDNLKIENPRLPTLRVRATRQEHAILLAGRPEKMTTTIRNIGMDSESVVVRFKLPVGVRGLGSLVHELGAMPIGSEKTIEWGVQSDEPSIGAATIQVTATGAPPLTARHQLVFFPSEDGLPPSASQHLPPTTPGESKAATYYIDSVAGNNARAGTSPKTAWKDFSKVNGKVLGPGERLLLRRGSIFNQELDIAARGTADNWAEIGAYGAGARPIIRRNGDIDDRCALIRNPDFLRIRSLVVCYAGKGLIVNYSQGGRRGLVIEDCIAHHIEGLYRFNAHGIPEWLGRRGATGDAVHNSPGIAIVGTPARDLVLRDCEMFQCSSGYFVHGSDVLVERVFCHDNYAHNTSPHPFLVDVHRAVLRDSVFDASGWHASAGTMGIMLGDPQGLIIRNCCFRNQPDSGSHDEGGIDFENSGNGCLIDHCTFQNNAGAAIEVLGLRSPQTTNIEIRKSRFIQNNVAHKLGPAEIYVWGGARDPSICCSSGTVLGNGYVLLPGVGFFTNEAPRLTSWTLCDNTAYKTVADLDRAMPYNHPPAVDAGSDIRTDQRRVTLAGHVSDDSLPDGKPLSVNWEVLEGPGSVAFDNAHSAATRATFDRPGDYVLRLVADDSQLWTSARVTVHILPRGTSVAAAWEFNKNLDKEGWTEVNPGTRTQHWLDPLRPDPLWSTTSHSVKLVAGGYYVVAIDSSSDAHLLSPDHLNLAITRQVTLVFRLQNHTPATEMRVRYTTDSVPDWADAKTQTFSVVPNDPQCRTYTVKLDNNLAGPSRLRQFRLDLATGQPLTGTCRIDYVWIISSSATH
jgi:hypothetical protein